jgi:CO dehydrogenase/acetyl-CoA synthase alpha subunit
MNHPHDLEDSMVKIIFCSRCGNPMAMTPENLAEREAISLAEYGKPMAADGLDWVCMDCYDADQEHPFATADGKAN